MSYIKVSPKEESLYLIAALNNIAPPSFSAENGTVVMEKHTPLIDIPLEERKKYCDAILAKLRRLHDIGLLWMDPSEENVVVNLKTDEVYLIDFGLSCSIGSLRFKDITVNEAFQIEEDEVRFFCGVGEKPDELSVVKKGLKRYLVKEEV